MASSPKFKVADWVTFMNRKKKHVGQILMHTTDCYGNYYYYVGHPSKNEDDWIIATEKQLLRANIQDVKRT